MSKYEDAVKAKIDKRAKEGLRKYGKTLERTDLKRLDWLNHLQEEIMDAANYLEVLIQGEKAKYTPIEFYSIYYHKQGD